MLQQLLWTISLLLLTNLTLAQNKLYPFKQNNQYGLIDSSGQQVIKPCYQYIGAFSEDGYAIVQKSNLLGVINQEGNQVIPCKYEFMNHTGRGLFAVKVDEEWEIINTQEEVILDKMPGEIEFLAAGYISFSEITGLGLAHLERGILVPPQYNRFEILSDSYVLAEDQDGNSYLYNGKGELVIEEAQEEVKINGNWIWTFRSNSWRIYDLETKGIRKKSISEQYTILQTGLYVLSIKDKVTRRLYDATKDVLLGEEGVSYMTFDTTYILYTNAENKKGVIDRDGNTIITAQYDDINSMDALRWRVRLGNKIGVVDKKGKVLIPMEYDYISKFSTAVALVRVGKKYGVIDTKGNKAIPLGLPSDVTLTGNVLRYKDTANVYKVVRFDEDGKLDSDVRFQNIKSIKINAFGRRTRSNRSRTVRADPNQISDSLVWRYHNMAGLWGLWHIQKKTWKYVPTFIEVDVYKDIGITVVKERKKNPTAKIITKDIDIKSYERLGVFNNSRGLPVTNREFLDIRVSDFRDKGLPIARVVFTSGRCGLMQRNGRVLKKHYVYIGEFVEGKARCTRVGRLDVDHDKRIGRPIESAENFYGGWECSYVFDDGNPKYYDLFPQIGQLHCREAKWGFVDTFGSVFVNMQYDFVEDYSNNRAMVKKAGKWGLITEEGIEIIPPTYDDFDYLPKADQQLFEIAQKQTFYGAVDTAGVTIVPVEYIKIRDFVEERVAVRSTTRRWGFIDKNGRMTVQPKYRLVHDYSEGLAVVYDKSRWGVIDKEGQEVIPPIYAQMGDFKEGKAWVALKKGYKGYVNKEGKLLFKGKYSRVTNFSKGRAGFYIRKKGWGLIDEQGNIIMRPKRKIKKIEPFNEHGLAKVRVGDKYRLIDRAGKFVGKRAFGIIRNFKEGYAVARIQLLNGNKIGKVNLNFVFIDTFGQIVPKRDFAQLQSFSEGRAAFRAENGKRGYINTKGEIVIAPNYFMIAPFKDNRAVVYYNYNTSGIIDTTGKEIIPVKYKSIIDATEGLALVKKESWQYFFVHEDTKRHTPQNFEKAHAFQYNMAPVKIAGKWGVINKKGIQVITPKYDNIKPFDRGIAKVAVYRLRGVVDVEGNIIIPPLYEHVEYVGDDLFRVERGDAVGYLSRGGSWVVQLQK